VLPCHVNNKGSDDVPEAKRKGMVSNYIIFARDWRTVLRLAGQLRLSLVNVLLVVAVLSGDVTPASGFDYSAYKPSSLKEIGDITKGTATKYRYEGGLDFYRERLKIRIRLAEYPGEISEGTKKALEYYFKVVARPNLEHLTLFTYQLNLEESGYSFILVFQKQLVPFLRKESKPGNFVNLYVFFGIYDIKNKRTILFVNEFDTDAEGVKKGRLPYSVSEG
jgi:hypothetical protein